MSILEKVSFPYGIELASEGTSVFFSLMGVFSSSSIPSTKTPAHNALQRTKGSSFPYNETKEKKMGQIWEFWESVNKWLSRNTQDFGTLDKCWKRFTTKGCIPFFCKRFLFKKGRPMMQGFKRYISSCLDTMRFGKKNEIFNSNICNMYLYL